ncbi:Phage shock protein A [Mycobacterium senriense]|uniref:35 kDa protein n=2 Tax=Mycobacterium senriense TaxID=2775496 RepID=A0ABN6IMV5_9MYCO|nr:hypothetical protein MTY59_46790 [Mycobacterium senriense]
MTLPHQIATRHHDPSSQYRDGMPDEPVTPGPTGPAPEYDDTGVPTFESVRDQIEARYATAQGAAELDAESPEGRSVDEQYDERRRAAAERLTQIRQSMRPDQG